MPKSSLRIDPQTGCLHAAVSRYATEETGVGLGWKAVIPADGEFGSVVLAAIADLTTHQAANVTFKQIEMTAMTRIDMPQSETKGHGDSVQSCVGSSNCDVRIFFR